MFNPSDLTPKLTNDLVTKVLAVEIYFQLAAGKSPVYFSVSDFANSYSIEILYIAVTLYLLAAWLAPIGMLSYWMFFGSIRSALHLIGSTIRVQGIPLFPYLEWKRDVTRVSALVAEDYARSTGNSMLLLKIKEFEFEKLRQVEGEYVATLNLLLVGTVVVLGHFGYPNFLMRVTAFSESFTYGYSYAAVCTLLIVQGVIGRVSNYHIFRDLGFVPGDIFSSVDERNEAENWSSNIARRHIPFIKRWISNNQSKAGRNSIDV